MQPKHQVAALLPIEDPSNLKVAIPGIECPRFMGHDNNNPNLTIMENKPETIRTYIWRIYERLHVHSRTEAVARYAHYHTSTIGQEG